LKNLIITY